MLFRSARAAGQSISLPEALLADGPAAAMLRDAGIGPAELAAAADPAGYLGAAAEFVGRALAAHDRHESWQAESTKGSTQSD